MSLICNGSTLMDNKYTYDNVDNILGIANAAKPASGDIGGASSHVYEYDAINRLISAQGSAKDQSYELQMRYDVMSNPLQKDTISYEYETYSHPNAVSRAGSKIFKYDANGNPISVEDTTTNALRVMQWDEENRLQSLGDDGYVSRYTYNHAGERVVKSHGGTTVAYVNGAPQGVIWDDQDNWTAYVSPYMVVNGDRFTKHYYVGSQRIASKIGVGEFNNLYDASKTCVTAGQKDFAERVSLITQSRDDYNAALGIAPGPPTAKGIYGEAEYSGAYGLFSIKPLGNYDVPTGWPSKPYKRPYGGTPGAPVMYQKPSDPDETGAGYGYSNVEGLSENDVYFYHSDHIGSTSYITDKDGNVSQFIAYKPFGKLLIDEHSVSYDSPWKFNGKEWDLETGLYYYGARYYEPGVGLWYGVDALAEKYPSVGGYVYCVGNPVKFVDVDGNQTTEYDVDGSVLSDLGGKNMDFYHQENGDIIVIDNTNDISATIKKGSRFVKGYSHRTSDVGVMDLFSEFLFEKGTACSLFADFEEKDEGVFGSLQSYNSTYASLGREDYIKNRLVKNKNYVPIKTGSANPFSAGTDMWEQFIGEAGISWYDFGDKVLFILTDAKSNTSFFYHFPIFTNYERGEGWFGRGTTYQTYIWTETIDSVKDKIKKSKE